LAQEPSKPPTFPAEAALVLVDVSVVDARGRPVRDLAPEDFRLEVDGRSRRIASAAFVPLGEEAVPASKEGAAPAAYSTNEGAVRGRLVVIAIDQGSARPGPLRAVTASADRLLDRLTPADRVGLLTFPPPGPRVELTAEHAEVRRALARVVARGQLTGRRLGLTESLALDDDPSRWSEVLNRECPPTLPLRDHEACVAILTEEARSLATEFRRNSSIAFDTLRGLFTALGTLEGPKTVVLLSQGLDPQRAAAIREIAQAAEAARVTLYVVRLESDAVADASRAAPAPAESEDAQHLGEGLDALASLTRGRAFRVAGTGEGIFDRIARELTGYYLLAFEPEEADRDDHSHDVRVRVAGSGLSVRSRRWVRIPRAGSTVNANEVLGSLLRSPFPVSELPLRVTAYNARDPEKPGVRLLLNAEPGGGAGAGSVKLAYVLLDGKGGMVANGAATLPEARPFLAAAEVPAGDYTLKVAALDGRGRRGSVEHRVKAGLPTASGIEISDLLLSIPGESQELRARIAPETDGQLVAAVEIYAREATPLAGARVTFEVAEEPKGPALLEIKPPEGPPGESPRRRPLQAVLDVGVLPPGDYIARASLSVGGHPALASLRPFRVRARLATGGGTAAPPRRMPARELGPALPRFDPTEALRPDVVAYFLGRLETLVGPPTTRAAQEARAHAAGGRPEAALDDLKDVTSDTLDVAFLRGLAYLARGELRPAETQLKSALRKSSEFVAAAFFMGACRAAGGEDPQAVGAWQTALAVESGAPRLRRLLGEALLRTDDPDAAIELLREAEAAGDRGLDRSLGLAYAMAGRRGEALASLNRHLDAKGDDLGALFVTLRLMFDAQAAGEKANSLANDRERFARYARSYEAAKGPQHELVTRWLKYFNERP
ncbi:MAG TPA: VWA domain-containing protein, partial [Vicinamibacteria bacterium]|nr:VWA domain-containing protein [Vicinamibacteria bacterium]